MSCIQLSHNHINYLVSFYSQQAQTVGRYLDTQEVAEVLYEENIKSYNYRYRDNFSPQDYPITFKSVVTNPHQALKAAQSYGYQSCEHTNWKNSQAKRYCDEIISFALTQILNEYETKYGKLDWMID